MSTVEDRVEVEPGSSLSLPAPAELFPKCTSSTQNYVVKFGVRVPRCTATSKARGERCGMNAVKGSNVCYYHGGVCLPKRGKPTHRFYSKFLTPVEVKIYRKALRGEGNADEIALLQTKVAGFIDRATKGEVAVDGKSLELLSQILVRLGNLREQDIRMAGMKSGRLDASGRAATQVQINVIWGGRESEVGDVIEGEVVSVGAREISPPD